MSEETTAVAVNNNYLEQTDKIDWLKNIVGKSKSLFGCNNFEEAAVLAITMQSENITPMEYLNTYDTVQGRPRMKSDAMLAKFVSAGGDYNVIKRETDECTVEFVWRDKTTQFTYTMEDAKTAGLVKSGGAYEKHPKNMLFLRCVSNGLRMYAPELFAGHYTKEEVMESAPTPPPVQVQPMFTETKPAEEKAIEVEATEVTVVDLPIEGHEVSHKLQTPKPAEVETPDPAEPVSAVDADQDNQNQQDQTNSTDYGWATCLELAGIDFRQALDWLAANERVEAEVFTKVKPNARRTTLAKAINTVSDTTKEKIENKIDAFKTAVEKLHEELESE